MVGRPAHPRGVFFEHPQAGQGLPRIEQDGARPDDRIDILPRQRRDAGQMLDGVERRAFGGEQSAGIAANAHQVGTGRHSRTLIDEGFNRAIGVKRAKERGGKRQPSDGHRVTAVHHRRQHRIGGDDGGGGAIAALPHILGERGSNKGGEVEALNHPSPAPASPPPPFRASDQATPSRAPAHPRALRSAVSGRARPDRAFPSC